MKATILMIIGVALLIVFSCSNESGGLLDRLLKGSGGGKPVTVESVVIEERSSETKIPATLEAPATRDVTLPEEVTIERLAVAVGDSVSVGDPLARISEQDLTSRLARRRTELKEAQATLDKNKYFLANRDRLLDEKRLDLTQYENLGSEITSNEATIEKLKSEISKLEELSTATTVASPFAGIVSEVNASAGMKVPAGKSLMSIIKPDPITASMRLPPASATTVRIGSTFTVRFPQLDGKTAIARVTSVGTELDTKDNTFEIKATIPNPAQLYKAGMKAEVSIPSADKRLLFIIPEEALIRERDAFFVFTVDKGRARKIQIIPSETVGTRVGIIRGLKEGDIVVVKGQERLAEGTIVDIRRR